MNQNNPFRSRIKLHQVGYVSYWRREVTYFSTSFILRCLPRTEPPYFLWVRSARLKAKGERRWFGGQKPHQEEGSRPSFATVAHLEVVGTLAEGICFQNQNSCFVLTTRIIPHVLHWKISDNRRPTVLCMCVTLHTFLRLTAVRAAAPLSYCRTFLLAMQA